MDSRIISNGEALIGLAGAGQPTNTHPSTVNRWASRGILRGASRVRLECVRAGGRLRTSTEAVARFFAALSAGPDQHPQPAPSATDRLRTIASAETALVAAGA